MDGEEKFRTSTGRLVVRIPIFDIKFTFFSVDIFDISFTDQS